MRTCLLLCLLSLFPVTSRAAIGPSSPPPGWSGTESQWEAVWNRSDFYAKKASKLVKGASQKCLHGVLLRVLGFIEAQVSADAVKGEPDVRMTVHPKDRARFDDALKRNRDEQCGPPGGSAVVESAEALARLGTQEADWAFDSYPGEKLTRADLGDGISYLYERAKPKLTPTTPWLLELLKLGIFVPAVEGAKAAASGVALPILNPQLFMKREAGPNDTI